MSIDKKTFSYISICVSVVLSAIVLFIKLGSLPIHLWDESRLATNAFEMYRKGLSWGTTFHYAPDSWNTKPPLLIWLQYCSFKLFGVSELALRLPSTLAGLCTCLVVAWFCAKKLKNEWLAIISIVVLCTCDGFVKVNHSTRTGDYDALLTFFSTCSILSFYLFTEEGRQKCLITAFLSLTCAVLTKGVAGLLFTPAILLFVIYRKKLTVFLKEPVFYCALMGFVAIIVGYYIIREQHDPGYFNWVKMNELGGRFLEKGMNASHPDEAWFYLKLVIYRNFSIWWWLLILGFVVSFFTKDQLAKPFMLFATGAAVLFLVIISCSKSKSEWYDMPVYPFLSIVAANGVYSIIHWVLQLKKPVSPAIRYIAAGLLVIYFVIKPYREELQGILRTEPGGWAVENTRMSKYLKNKLDTHEYTPLLVLKNKDYEANIDWYRDVMNYKAGKPIVTIIATEDLPTGLLIPGATVAVYQEKQQLLLNAAYNCSKAGEANGVVFYRIGTRKDK